MLSCVCRCCGSAFGLSVCLKKLRGVSVLILICVAVVDVMVCMIGCAYYEYWGMRRL